MSRRISTTEGGATIALDFGSTRIGVAIANPEVQHIVGAQPLTTLETKQNVIEQVQQLISQYQASMLVVGLPRGLNGQDTDQTQKAKEFALQLKSSIDIPMYWQDEALTSKQAESELQSSGKIYSKADIDALAACYILNDFLNSEERVLI